MLATCRNGGVGLGIADERGRRGARVTITHENGFSMESELWWKGVEEIWNRKFFYDVRCTAFEWRGGNNSEYFSVSMTKMCKVFSWQWMWWSRSGNAQIIGFCDPLFAMRLFECINDAQVTVCCFGYLCKKRFPLLLHLRTLNPFWSS